MSQFPFLLPQHDDSPSSAGLVRLLFAALARLFTLVYWIGGMEGVAEGDFLHVARVGIVLDLGVDEEQHRHAHLLPRLQPLLGKAEALDLGEILTVSRGCSG